MHERTRRAISRMTFVFCCAAPTTLTLLMIVWTWTPWAHRSAIAAVKDAISDTTGGRVELTDYRPVAPGHHEIDSLRLCDAETGDEVLRVRQLAVSSDENRTAMVLQQPEMHAATLASAWRMLDQRFLRSPDLTEIDYRVAANDLSLHSGGHSLTMRDVDAWIESDEQSVSGNLRARLSSQPEGSPVLFSVKRQRTKPAATTWTIATGDHRLPLSVLADFHDGVFRWFGPDATMRGTASWTQTEDHWSLDLSGCRLESVALDQLMIDSPHRLSGIANIDLHRGKIVPGRHLDIAGTIIAVDGHIGNELLLAAANHLECSLADIDQEHDLRFDQMAIHFQINDTQMRLEGICRTLPGSQAMPVGIAVCAGGQPVLATPTHSLATIRLASLMAPRHAVPVPLASQNHAVATWLLPPSRPPIVTSPTPPRVKVRTAAAPHNAGETISQPLR